MSPVFSEKTGREKRRNLHESPAELGRAGQGRGAEEEPQCNWGAGGVFRKPHKIARLSLVTGCLLSPRRGQGMLGGSSAAGGVRHVCPSQLSSSETLEVGRGENVPKA